MNTIGKRGWILLALGLVAAIAAVGGYAYFTSTGTGSGSGSVGTSTAWQVTTDAAVGAALTPGGPSQTVGYHVKNNSTGYQSLANVAIKVANSNGTVWTAVAGCSKDDFNVGAGAGVTFNDIALAGNIAPGATVNGTITLSMVDTGSNQDGCKLAAVPLHLSAS
jgi:hypothetical protein